MSGWIFGYGSLVADSARRDPSETDWCWTALRDHRRAWNVAMDNTAPEADTKHYVDPASGERPDVAVTFLNVYPAADALTNGIAIHQDEAEIAQLDLRESHYTRVDVSELVAVPGDDPVWTYEAKPEALARYERALLDGKAFVSHQYYEYCLDAFEAGGEARLSAFEASTDERHAPLRSLDLVRKP